MRSIQCIVAGLVVVASMPASVVGQDLGAVRTAVLEHYAAINSGDYDAVADHHGEPITAFLGDGLLTTWGTRQEQVELFRAMWAAGFNANWEVRSLEVRGYGDVAVATAYLVGSVQYPGGPVLQGTWRLTEVWVREGREWKEVHHHDSPLVTGVSTR